MWEYSKSITDKGLIFLDDKAFDQHPFHEHKCDICNKYCDDYYSFKINGEWFNGHKDCYLDLLKRSEDNEI
jgi:hypothetical protein